MSVKVLAVLSPKTSIFCGDGWRARVMRPAYRSAEALLSLSNTNEPSISIRDGVSSSKYLGASASGVIENKAVAFQVGVSKLRT